MIKVAENCANVVGSGFFWVTIAPILATTTEDLQKMASSL